jgi:hypothetical protein
LQVQFRVNKDDEIHCKSALCDGLLANLVYTDGATNKTAEHHLIFSKSFTGPYTWDKQIPIEFKTWPDGSKRYLSKKLGIVAVLPDAPGVEQNASYFYNCVDIVLTNSPDHRCRDFKKGLAQVINE